MVDAGKSKKVVQLDNPKSYMFVDQFPTSSVEPDALKEML